MEKTTDPLPKPLPPRPASEPPRGSWLAIFLALGTASMVGAGLSFVTLFYLLPVFVVGAAIFFVAAFHYLVWGWWVRSLIDADSLDADGAAPLD